MFRHFLLGFAMAVLAVAGAQADDAKIRIKVSPQTPMHTFDLTKSKAELTKGRPATGLDTEGLTTVEFTYGYSIPQLQPAKTDKGICIVGDVTLELRVGFKPPLVQIARELKPDTCDFFAAVGHEMKHVAAAQETVGVLVAKAPRLFAIAASKFARACAPDAEGLKDLIRQRLGEALAGIRQIADADNTARSAVIDTADEYSRVHAICTVR